MPSATRKGREGRGEAPHDCEVTCEVEYFFDMDDAEKKHYCT